MTTWADCAPTVAKAAPLLGWLLGPLDTIAGGAVGAIVSSVVGTPADDPEAAAAAIAADPTLLERLREAELANQAILASYALQQRQAEWAAQTANDAQGAPQIQSDASAGEIARNLSGRQPGDRLRLFLGCVIVLATIGIVFLVLLGFADDTLRDPVIAATAGGLVMYFLKESDKVTSFLFGATSEATNQAREVTNFAISPGKVTASAELATTTVQSTAKVGPVRAESSAANIQQLN